MRNIPKKTLEDLEFPTVLGQASQFCLTPLGKERMVMISPLKSPKKIHNSLKETSEYLASYTNENRIPNHGFDAISKELKLLKVENTTLELAGFRKIGAICNTVITLKKFFKKFKEYYPLLFAASESVESIKEIPEEINAVIDRFGEIKDSASSDLKKIRHDISGVKIKMNQSFGNALRSYQTSEYLDEIRESVVENRRVLAVKAMYRKKVKGTVMGSSKTGSIVYIVPEASLKYGRELNNLEFDEKEEIQRILNQLTSWLRPYIEDLKQYQEFLVQIDIISAKTKYALETNALLPEINEQKRLFLRDAYHPLLLLTNKKKKEKTWPQTIELHDKNRIIVISGPNAGGKSITLKTIGLLQVMLQSGFLIPVHERSSMCFFEQILTDIGDNQSIENHLSTYSYRLRNMNRFLRKCDENTLFLIDEFGTGSDPELGGALAEAFLEVFYERNSFGIITTHYANLKLLADELPHATNANMLFDSKTLNPIYHLELGQPGSSFTFEVAQQTGIPYSLINKARKKVEGSKLRFDVTIAKLQKERSKMAKTGSKLQVEESKAREETSRLEDLNKKVKSKLENYQQLYDHDQRMVYLGNKVNKAAEKYFQDKKKRPLVSELLRIVETENSKRKKKSSKEINEGRVQEAKTTQEVQKEIAVIRRKKKEEKKSSPIKKDVLRPALKVGDRVRLLEGKAVGSIDSIEKNKATVNYGQFTTNVSTDQLELVESKKIKKIR